VRAPARFEHRSVTRPEEQALAHWAEFQESLSSEKRKYPKRQFDVFWNAAQRYAELQSLTR
jgi:hypothetical protein